jgi:hypothetical protein
MRARRLLKISLGLAAVCACFLFFWSACREPTPLLPHQGDGKFKDLRRPNGPFWIAGYSVTMPDFDLSQSHQAEYRVRSLPAIGRKCGVYLAFHDVSNQFISGRGLIASVTLEVLDAQGNIFVKAAGPLGDFIWYGTGDLHCLYQLDKSFFNPATAMEYRLRITYTPDQQLARFRGFVYLECGGHV